MRNFLKGVRLATIIVVFMLLVISPIVPSTASKVSANEAITLKPGDIIATCTYYPENTLYKIDSISGALEVISSGGLLNHPMHVALKYGSDGSVTDIFVANYNGDNIIRVDPSTGAHSVVASGITTPAYIVVDGQGDILVASEYGAAVMRVNPVTGVKSVISSGGSFQGPFGLAIERDGNLIVVDCIAYLVFRVDPKTGAQTVLSSGPFDYEPLGVAIDSNGDIIITEIQYYGTGTVSRLNRVTGTRTVISTGGYLSQSVGLAIEGNGNILVADYWAFRHYDYDGGAIIRINPSTGAQSIVSIGGSFMCLTMVNVNKVTYASLGNLVKQFVTKQGVINSLLSKLDNAQKAEAKGNTNSKAGMISAFINEVEAQTGKAISAENAAILINLARAL